MNTHSLRPSAQFSDSYHEKRKGHAVLVSWMEKLEQYAPWSLFEIAVGIMLIVAFLTNL